MAARRPIFGTPDPAATRRLGLAIAASVFALDQFVKVLVLYGLSLRDRPERMIELLPIFRLQLVENHGISMGFLTADSRAGSWLLIVLTAGIAAAVLGWLWQERNRTDATALALVLGGALGNIVDRTRTGLTDPTKPGYVIDFLNLHFGTFSPFLVFNVADAAITIGVLLLVLRALFVRQPAKPPAEDVHA